jgi:GNAT superfamily N-acetyltransferase
VFRNVDNGREIVIFVKLCPRNVYYGYVEWLQTFHVTCIHNNEEIGHALGHFVDREQVRSQFMEHMFMQGGVLKDLATWIFDRYGQMRREYKGNLAGSTPNNWDEELDWGSFFVIDSVYVHRDWRENGLAGKMIDMMIDKAGTLEKPAVSVFVVPGFLETDIWEQLAIGRTVEQIQDDYWFGRAATFMFSGMGFRRIGSSPCLARVAYVSSDDRLVDPNQIDLFLQEDQWYHRKASTIGQPFGDWEDQLKRFEEHKDDLPILYATATLQDDDLVKYYEELQAKYDPTEDWFETDNFGRNILHVAALGFKAKSLEWLFENEIATEDLMEAVTSRGYKPLQELKLRLDILRVTDGVSTRSDTFGGFCDDAVECLAMLNQPPGELPEIDHFMWLRLRFGCDCGECVGGLMSGSMSHVLSIQARYLRDNLAKDDQSDSFWGMMSKFWCEHASFEAFENFQVGKLRHLHMVKILNTIIAVLDEGNVPTLNRIKKDLKKDMSNLTWLNHPLRGVEPKRTVLQIVFEFARDQDDCAGTQRFGRSMEDYRDIKDWALRKCRNDREYGFVALQCGIYMD